MTTNEDPKLLSLIRAVRKNTNLYDFRLNTYKDENFKSKVWESVAVECDYRNGAEAKEAWNRLYESFMELYRNELIRFVRVNYNGGDISLPQEGTTEPISQWSYFNDMRFIAPFRYKNRDPELERLVELAKPLVLRKSHEKTSCREESTANIQMAGSTSADPENGNLYQNKKRKYSTAIAISAVSASAKTQTPNEKLVMDIPSINEETMTEKEMILHSFFDAIYRTTVTLPVKFQNKVKLEMLQALHKAEHLASVETVKGKVNWRK